MDAKDIEILSKIFDDKTKIVAERLEGMRSKFDAEFINVHDTLNRIEEQTKKTNGRVTKLEEGDDNYVNCPNTKDVREMKESLFEYNIFKKYPKIAVGLVAVACIILIGVSYLGIRNFTDKAQNDMVKLIQIEILKQLSK